MMMMTTTMMMMMVMMMMMMVMMMMVFIIIMTTTTMMMMIIVVVITINILLVILLVIFLVILLVVLVEVSGCRTLVCKSVETPVCIARHWLADQLKFANLAAAVSLVVHPRCHLHLRHNSDARWDKSPHVQNSSGSCGSLNASRSQPMAFRSPKTVEWRADSGQGIWKTPAPEQGRSPHCIVNWRQRLLARLNG